MTRRLKVVSGIIITLVVAVVALVLWINAASARKMQRVVTVSVAPVPFATGTEALARGKHFFESRGCGECHGADGKGKVFIDAPNGLYVKTPNITGGTGSAAASYNETDWVRTLRHGVKPRGQALLIMPSEDYNRLTDADLAALVAYIRGLPPVDGDGAIIRFPLLLRALYAFGVLKDAAEKIDHTLPPSTPIAEGPTAEYGAYVANMCKGCHGDGYSGGKIPGTPPDWPPAANLTPGAGSVLARYPTADSLKAMLRSGKRPDGGDVSTVMPFSSLSALSDVEVEAMYAFLKTLAPKAAGNR